MTNTTTTTTTTIQCVWLVRYGLTEHALIEDVGPYDSDIDPNQGMDHAKCIAKRIAKGHTTTAATTNTTADDRTVAATIPKYVYADPFMRTTHTGHIIVQELMKNNNSGTTCTKTKTTNRDQDPKLLRSEEGLYEWLIPSLLIEKKGGIQTYPKSVPELMQHHGFEDTMDATYQSVHPYTTFRATLPESEEQLFQRTQRTVTEILQLHHATTYDSICIVTHAPCNQAIAFSCFDDEATTPNESKIVKPLPLGGISMFSRTITTRNTTSGDDGTKTTTHEEEDEHTDNGKNDVVILGKWKCEFFGSTTHMPPGEYQEGCKAWSLPCFANN